MSRDGRSFSQILDFYYSNTQVEHLPGSGSSDQSLIELPVLASGSSLSATADSASLKEVSGGNATPKENNSTIFEGANSSSNESVKDDKNIWDTPNTASSTKATSAPKKKATRRVGL